MLFLLNISLQAGNILACLPIGKWNVFLLLALWKGVSVWRNRVKDGIFWNFFSCSHVYKRFLYVWISPESHSHSEFTTYLAIDIWAWLDKSPPNQLCSMLHPSQNQPSSFLSTLSPSGRCLEVCPWCAAFTKSVLSQQHTSLGKSWTLGWKQKSVFNSLPISTPSRYWLKYIWIKHRFQKATQKDLMKNVTFYTTC